MEKHSNKLIVKFLEKSFSQFKSNSIYKPKAFKELLVTAAQGKARQRFYRNLETASSVLHGANQTHYLEE